MAVKTSNYGMFESLFYTAGTMKSFSAIVTKDLMINRLFKIVVTKCLFDLLTFENLKNMILEWNLVVSN